MEKECFDQLVSAGPPPGPAKPSPAPKLATISAIELQHKEIPAIQYVVDGLLPHGLSLLCSPPKYGKSWLVLDLCLAVAAGEPFLGHTTHQSGCLYLALEDSERRLKLRQSKLLDGEDAPIGFEFATETSGEPITDSICDTLDNYLMAHPNVGLVVIDTLQCVRGASGKDVYASDYRDATSFKVIADKHNVALLLVHHLRKMRDDADPFNMISGSNGLMGAADTTMVLTRDNRSDASTTLHVVGRDIESSETLLTFDTDTCRWSVLGDAAPLETLGQRRYNTDPIVRTVKALLSESPDGWSGTASALMDAGVATTGQKLAPSPRALSSELSRLKDQFWDDGIDYTRISRGTGGGVHRFRPCSLCLSMDDLPEIDF